MNDNEKNNNGFYNKITTATKWSFITEITAKLIVPLTNMVLARILTPEIFGILTSINVVISFADMIADSGFNRYLMQRKFDTDDELYKTANIAFWSHFTLSVFLYSIIVIFRYQIAGFVGNSGYEIPLVIASFSLPCTSMTSIQIALYRRKFEYKKLYFNRLLAIATPFAVTIPLAMLKFEYWSIIIGTLCGLIIQIINLTYKSKWKPQLYYKFNLLKKMISFSIWTLVESVALWASSWIDIFIIGNILGPYYTGLYKTSQSTVTGIFNIITSSLNSVAFVSLSQVQDDNGVFTDILMKFQKYVSIFIIPLGVGLFIFRNLITNILLGSSWIEASDFIGIWGLCTAFVASYGTLCRESYRAKGKPKISLFAQISHLIFVVPVCYFSVLQGFDVLIYTRSLIYLQIIIVHFIFMKIFMSVSPFIFLKNTFPILFSSALMGIGAYLLKNLVLHGLIGDIITISVSVVFYFLCLLLFPEYRTIIIDFIRKGIKICLKKINY